MSTKWVQFSDDSGRFIVGTSGAGSICARLVDGEWVDISGTVLPKEACASLLDRISLLVDAPEPENEQTIR